MIRDLLAFRGTTLPVFRNLRFFKRLHQGTIPSRMSLQSKLTLILVAVLVVAGTLGFFVLERTHALRDAPLGGSILASLFQAVTPRTAGFHTIAMGELQSATLILVIVLMVIGAGPVSTGGGIKTVTFGVMLLTLRSMLTGREDVGAFGRTIPRMIVRAAISVFVIYVMVATAVVFLLSITDPHMDFLSQVFEAVSALSTTGLSTGVTADLSGAGKLVLCLAMFAGRVGPLTLVMSIFRSRRASQALQYPEETLVVG